MNRLRCGAVQPIQVPMALGAMKSGVDRGARMLDETLRTHLEQRVQPEILARICSSIEIPVAGLELPDARRYPGRAIYLEQVADASERTAEEVKQAIDDGSLALTLGGDHAVSIGSIAGAASSAERLAVIWIDAHADLNWPEVSLTGRLHGMPLGVALGRGDSRLTELMGPAPKIRSTDTHLVGIRELDPGEKTWIGEGCCSIATMADIDEQSVDGTLTKIIDSIRNSDVDAVHISFDVDSLDPLIMPGTGTPVRGGFNYREAARILRLLRKAELPIRSIDWVELNPDLDPSNTSAEVAADLLAIALGDEVF